jgi:hypothetical protein
MKPLIGQKIFAIARMGDRALVGIWTENAMSVDVTQADLYTTPIELVDNRVYETYRP